MTYREVCYFVKDMLKQLGDDSTYENEHIVFLSDKYRTLLLKKYYDSIKKPVPDSCYQTICFSMSSIEDPYICSGFYYAKSNEQIPFTTEYGSIRVYSENYFTSNINLVSKERFEFCGLKKYTNKLLYASIGPDRHLYIKSSQPIYIDSIKITAVFESPIKAVEMDCVNGACAETLEVEFPLDEALIPELLQMLIQQFLSGLYRGKDPYNNANDDLSDVAKFIRASMKDRYVKDYQDGEGDK